MNNDVLNKIGLFWQYPVKTEEEFYNQNKDDSNYIGFPWATVLDKKVNIKYIYDKLKEIFNTDMNYYTCCQHISFRLLIPLFSKLNINTIYTPHKIVNEDVIDGVKIMPCPLYAVNIEDPIRNKQFQNISFENIERVLLYSFQGAYNPKYYKNDIRHVILNIKHPENTNIKHIGDWHFDNVVYSKKQNMNKELNVSEKFNNEIIEYNELLLKSRYSLCPSGTGPNSIRFWESLAVGSIPVLLSDSLELPKHHLWNEAIIRLEEKKVKDIVNILTGISIEEENKMRKNCLIIYSDFRNNYASNTLI